MGAKKGGKMSVSLKTRLCGLKLTNPTILASGVVGVTGETLVRAAREGGAGAVATKSFSLKPRAGYPNPVIVGFEHGFLNAVGLSNPGVEEEVREIKLAKARARVPVIASIFGETAREFGEVAARASETQPDLIEVNVSCPNVEAEFGKPFALDVEATRRVVEEVKNSTRVPVSVKLSPNALDIKEIARACVEAGADAITAINTVGPGMQINIEARAPVLSNKVGGLSGPAIKPIAVRCVYDIYEEVDVPVIGTGGVLTGRDAIELMMAGASAVGIGSGVYYRGITVFKKVCSEMRGWMNENGFSKVNEIVGIAHENRGTQARITRKR